MSKSSIAASYNSSFACILRGLLELSPKTEEKTTYKALANYLGVKQQSVSSWANGSTVPDTKHIAPLAVFFGVSCDYLLGRTRTAAPDDFIQEACKRYGLEEDALNTLEWLAAPTQYSNTVIERILKKTSRLYNGEASAEQTDDNKLTAHEEYILSQKIQSDINRANLQVLNELLTVSTKRAVEGEVKGETYGLVILHAIYSYCHKNYNKLTMYNKEWGSLEATSAETQRASNLQLVSGYCMELAEALKSKKVFAPKSIRATKSSEQRNVAIKTQEANDANKHK